MTNQPDPIAEQLLDEWVSLSTAIINQKLVPTLTYGESVVCAALYHGGSVIGCTKLGMTATELCCKTGILKSQMNRVLVSLEKQGLVERHRSEEDRRRIEIFLDAGPESAYMEQRSWLVKLARKVMDRMGEEKVEALLPLLADLEDSARDVFAESTSEMEDE